MPSRLSKGTRTCGLTQESRAMVAVVFSLRAASPSCVWAELMYQWTDHSLPQVRGQKGHWVISIDFFSKSKETWYGKKWCSTRYDSLYLQMSCLSSLTDDPDVWEYSTHSLKAQCQKTTKQHPPTHTKKQFKKKIIFPAPHWKFLLIQFHWRNLGHMLISRKATLNFPVTKLSPA